MNYYFVSDVHLGLPVGNTRLREQRFVRWLDDIKTEAAAVFLLGDIFDFWYEYKTVVPRGYTRTLGKLAELTDGGIPVHFLPGNHDLWVSDYLSDETGLTVHRNPLEIVLGDQLFYLAHGHHTGTLSPADKNRQRVFNNRFLRSCFTAIHPRWGIALGRRWSYRNRLAKGVATPFRYEEEPLVQFSVDYSKTHPIHHFVFGHLHTPIQCPVGRQSQLTILGEWIQGCEYAVFDGRTMRLERATDNSSLV